VRPAAAVAAAVAAVVFVIACRRDDPGPKPTTPLTKAQGTGSGSAVVGQRPEAPLPDDRMTREIADAACPSVTGAYFYRIEKDGKTSHLLGTRHLGVDIAKFPKEVTSALTAAAIAVFETAPDDHSDGQVGPAERTSLPDELGPELWKHYELLVGDEFASRLTDADAPTALLVMMALYEDKSSALDDQLQDLAAASRIEILGLETSAFQERLIRRWLDMRALRAAVKVTDDRAELKQTTVDDLTEYCAGTDADPGPDPKERQEMIDGGYTEAEIAQYEEELVYSRNRDWIPKLEKLFASGDAFVAVGADHLIGEEGVVALLGKRGYKVTRVFSPAPKP
jgi:uncharacterized protein YbaP (TraB family)